MGSLLSVPRDRDGSQLDSVLRPRALGGQPSQIIEPQDGRLTLAGAGELFRKIDPAYHTFNQPSRPTEETAVEVLELACPKLYPDMFLKFSQAASFSFTQSQIRRFCAKYPEVVGDEDLWTLFPLEIGDKYYFSVVYTYDGLSLGLFWLNGRSLWFGGTATQMVLPSAYVNSCFGIH